MRAEKAEVPPQSVSVAREITRRRYGHGYETIQRLARDTPRANWTQRRVSELAIQRPQAQRHAELQALINERRHRPGETNARSLIKNSPRQMQRRFALAQPSVTGWSSGSVIQRYPPRQVGEAKWVDDELPGQEFETEQKARAAYFDAKNTLPGYLPPHDWNDAVVAGRARALAMLRRPMVTAAEVLDELAQWRRDAANRSVEILGRGDAEPFGRGRAEEAETPIREDTYKRATVEEYARRRQQPRPEVAQPAEPAAGQSTFRRPNDTGIFVETAVWGDVDDTQEVYPLDLTTARITGELGEPGLRNEIGRWMHTPQENIRVVMERVAVLQGLILAPGAQLAPGTVIRQIAEIHWLLAQAMPWDRGSASIAEVYTDALKELMELRVIPVFRAWKADIAAFLLTLQEFIEAHEQAYVHEFSKPPDIPL